MIFYTQQAMSVYQHMAFDIHASETIPQLQFRWYTCSQPSITFGYNQAFESVRRAHPNTQAICRRPTGGGIVHHQNDLTYSLIIPHSHTAYTSKAKDIYFNIHNILKNILVEILKLNLVLHTQSSKTAPLNCFIDYSEHDLILRDNYTKIAGAAIRKSHTHLLIQGNIQLPFIIHETSIKNQFAKQLSLFFASPAISTELPPLSDYQQLLDKMESTDWLFKK